MSQDDRQVNIRVDQMLVRRGIDTAKLSVSTSKGTVLIVGALKSRSKHYEVKAGTDMKQIDMALRRIPNVKTVTWNLTNWKKDGDTWKKLAVAEKAADH